MAKITYADKEAMNIDPSIPAKNKCMADDLNQIKNVVNENENKTLISISSTAPSQCTTGDLYFNTTSKKIFTATATDTWSSTGEDPTENTLYLYDNTIYSYDGTTLVQVGGSGTSEISISTTTPVDPDNELKLWINPNGIISISNDGYSTSSQNTGEKWINDKDVYRQVLVVSGEKTGMQSIPLGISCDEIINATLISNRTNNGSLQTIENGIPILLQRGSTTSAIQFSIPSGTTFYGYKLIIEYTKQ